MAAQHAQKTTMVFELRNDLTGQLQEVVLKNAHNMEPIGHDAGVGEPFSHQGPVSTGEVDANHLDLLTPLQGGIRKSVFRVGWFCCFFLS